MDPLYQILAVVDPVLIAPYRWPGDPTAGWWLGTVLLCLWCTLLGEATMALVFRINHRFVRRAADDVSRLQDQSFKALEAGDKEAYQGINKLANDAHGKAFFLQIAMGASSLWPAFFGAAWLVHRFSGLEVGVPFTPWAVAPLPAYVGLYVLERVAFSRLKRLAAREESPARDR
jgi:hypothetical protein